MPNETTNEVLLNAMVAKLCQYLDGEIDLRAFKKWYVPNAWDMEEEMVHSISLRLAEYSIGHWTEAELKRHLADIHQKHKIC